MTPNQTILVNSQRSQWAAICPESLIPKGFLLTKEAPNKPQCIEQSCGMT
jgi:hypothetical protein